MIEDFDESDQAGLIHNLKLPDDWYDNRPFEERFKNFGIMIPKGSITINCKICSRIIEEEAHYCEITDCPHK
jgi:hypothetical protein